MDIPLTLYIAVLLGHLIALAGFIRAVVNFYRQSKSSCRSFVPVAVFLAIWTLFMFRFFTASVMPDSWVTPLHAGLGMRNLETIYGATHAGPVFLCVSSFVASFSPALPPVKAVAHLNLWLWGVDASLFLVLALEVSGSVLFALAVWLACFFNPVIINSSLSELPSNLLFMYFLVAAVLLRAQDLAVSTPRERYLYWASLLALCALSLGARIETLFLSAPALALAAGEIFPRADIRPAVERLMLAVGKYLSGIASRKSLFWLVMAVFVFSAAWDVLSSVADSISDYQARAVFQAVAPLTLNFCALPAFLSTILPAGAVLMFLSGFVYALCEWKVFLALPLALAALFQLYYSASSCDYMELMRYCTLLIPLAMFIALFGYRQMLRALAHFGVDAAAVKLFSALVLLLFTVTMRHAAFALMDVRDEKYCNFPGKFHSGWSLPPESNPVLISRDNQLEVRHLLRIMSAHPGACFLTKTAGDSPPYRAGYSIFGGRLRWPVQAGNDWAQALSFAQNYSQGRELFFYQGYDCNLLDFSGCQKETAGHVQSDRVAFGDLPFNSAYSYGKMKPDIEFALYRLSLLQPAICAPGR
jgi:hypothetical protein